MPVNTPPFRQSLDIRPIKLQRFQLSNHVDEMKKRARRVKTLGKSYLNEPRMQDKRA